MAYKLQNSYKLLLIISLIIVKFTACSYSFTGASVPAHLKTIFIANVDDRSGTAEPMLRETFREKLLDKFIKDNTLQFSDRAKSDLILEATVVALNDAPAAVSADETIAARRINISVRVVCKDMIKRKNFYEASFSNYSDYISASGKKAAINEALDKISEDILMKTVSNW